MSLIIRKDKKGLASAVIDGLRATKGEIVGAINADLQHPPEILPHLIERIKEGADIAIASRYIEGGSCEEWGLMRRAISWGATTLAHLLLPTTREIKDPMSGFYMLRKQVISNCSLKPTGYKILLEILTQGDFEKVAEVPYAFGNRRSGYSKLGVRNHLEYLLHIFSLMRRTRELLRFFKFCLIGAIGILINMGLLWLLTEFAGLPYLASGTIAIESAIISNFTMNDFFTFSDRRKPGIKSFLQRLGKYNLVSGFGLGINLGTLWLLSDVAGLYYLLSNICGIILATLFRYIVNLGWTWR